MVARGHHLHDLLFKYPISTLNELATAARHNERENYVMTANGVLAAVMHSMDAAFNKGKNKIMKGWMNKMYPVTSSDSTRPTGNSDAAEKLLKFFAPRGK